MKANETNQSLENQAVENLTFHRFDNGEKYFGISNSAIAELIAPDAPQVVDPMVLGNVIEIMLKDLVHRSSWAKGIDDSGKDETDRLLDVLQGTVKSGRFKVTDEDREKAKSAMKRFAMAPEAFKQQYLANNGQEYVDDFEELAKRYMNRRAAAKRAEKENL
jgi:hypothetical protein